MFRLPASDRKDFFHPGEPGMGASGLAKPCRERTKTRGNLGRAAPLLLPLRPGRAGSPIHLTRAATLQHTAVGRAQASWDTMVAMTTCSSLAPHGPRRHRGPRQEGKRSRGRRGPCREVTPRHGASLHSPLSCVQKMARDGKRKRCHFRDGVSKEIQIYSKNFTGVLQTGTGPRGQLSTVNVITVLFRDL